MHKLEPGLRLSKLCLMGLLLTLPQHLLYFNWLLAVLTTLDFRGSASIYLFKFNFTRQLKLVVFASFQLISILTLPPHHLGLKLFGIEGAKLLFLIVEYFDSLNHFLRGHWPLHNWFDRQTSSSFVTVWFFLRLTSEFTLRDVSKSFWLDSCLVVSSVDPTFWLLL